MTLTQLCAQFDDCGFQQSIDTINTSLLIRDSLGCKVLSRKYIFITYLLTDIHSKNISRHDSDNRLRITCSYYRHKTNNTHTHDYYRATTVQHVLSVTHILHRDR